MIDSKNIINVKLYIGKKDNTWYSTDIELLDDGIFPVEDLLFHYMKENNTKFENIMFYGILEIRGCDYY